MTRQMFRLFSLLIFVLLMQWNGAVHALSHLGDDQEQPHAACELCVAYSVFDHTLADTAAKPPTPANTHSAPASQAFQVAQFHRNHRYHSRAPPQPAF